MKQEIAAAFGHRRRPPIVTTVAVSSTLRDDARYFEGMDWREVTADDWRMYSDAFFGFSAEGFLYFLPSLLMVSLETSSPGLVAADLLVSSLDTSGDPDLWTDWFSDRFRRLTLPELRALKDWSGIYLRHDEKGEGSEFARVEDTLAMLALCLES